jgi:hypothetical protein
MLQYITLTPSYANSSYAMFSGQSWWRISGYCCTNFDNTQCFECLNNLSSMYSCKCYQNTFSMGILSKCWWFGTALFSMVCICLSFILPVSQRKASQKKLIKIAHHRNQHRVMHCPATDIYWGYPLKKCFDNIYVRTWNINCKILNRKRCDKTVFAWPLSTAKHYYVLHTTI